MLTLTHTLAGQDCVIRYPECRADLAAFDTFRAMNPLLGWDTESTSLDIYSAGHGLRLAQFGNATESWVLRCDMFGMDVLRYLRQAQALTAHNGGFDALTVEHHLGVSIEELWPRLHDTRISAHLLDPRAPDEGGIGTALKPLSVRHIDPRAAEPEKDLMAAFRKLKLTKATGWAGIPIDHPAYIRYAGLDAILAYRMHALLARRVERSGLAALSTFEHYLQLILTKIQRRGMRVDVPYVAQLDRELRAEAEHHQGFARVWYGVDNVNSTAQVATGLLESGAQLSERTPTGKYKVDRAVLMPLADLDADWQRLNLREPNALADAVLRAKRADKWSETYASAFLARRDRFDHVHPSIGGLQARTARMSVSRPALQQLPTSDWRIRRSFIPLDGWLMIAADLKQVEMCVLAGLSRDAAMIEAIRSGADLHDYTAERIFGRPFTKQQRKVAKTIGFGKVYQGGIATLSRQSGIPAGILGPAANAYDALFPGIKRYARDLIRQAERGAAEVVTPWGRRLPLDAHRLYAGVNYVVQSSARDLLAAALVNIFNAGLGEYVLLPIHDEVLGQAPADIAKDVLNEFGRIMTTTFYDVPITADLSVYGDSWGAGYGAPGDAHG